MHAHVCDNLPLPLLNELRLLILMNELDC